MEWLIWVVAGLGMACGVIDVVLQRRANKMVITTGLAATTHTGATTPTTTRPNFNFLLQHHPEPQPEPEPFYSPYPVLGWRIMQVSPSSPISVTVAGAHNQTWKHPYLEAKCERRRCAIEELHWACDCGIYAYNNPTSIDTRIKNWGNFYFLTAMEHVLQYTRGYRAGRAWLIGAAPAENPRVLSPLSRQLQSYLPLGHVASSPLKLERMADYYTNNPERIPTWEQWVTLCAESNR